MEIQKIADALLCLAYDMEFDEKSENYKEEISNLLSDLQYLKDKESVLFNCLEIIANENEK